MPEFILPAEADNCPFCHSVLYIPPECCDTMKRQYYHELEENADSFYGEYYDGEGEQDGR
jgi:hypothetical protein